MRVFSNYVKGLWQIILLNIIFFFSSTNLVTHLDQVQKKANIEAEGLVVTGSKGQR